MRLKQVIFDVIDDKNILHVYCDEPCHTDLLLRETILLGNKPANRISLHAGPRTSIYCLKSYLWLPNFKRHIYKQSHYCTKESLAALLESINILLKQAA